jgi:hypothetical protein
MAQPIGMKACSISLVFPYSVENGVSNKGEGGFKIESVENGVTDRNPGVFKVYNLLKLALIFPYFAENGGPNRSTVKFGFDIHLNIGRPIGAKVCYGFLVN